MFLSGTTTWKSHPFGSGENLLPVAPPQGKNGDMFGDCRGGD